MATESIETFNVDWSNKYGFYAVAAKDLQAGDIVIHENPFAFQIFPEFQGKMCEACFKQSGDKVSMSRCSRCKQVCYCSRECQTQHWNLIHKLECKVFEQSDPEFLTDTPRILFRSYLKIMSMIQIDSEKQSGNKKKKGLNFQVPQDIHSRWQPSAAQLQKMNSSAIPRTHIHSFTDYLNLISDIDKPTGFHAQQLNADCSRLLRYMNIDPTSQAKYYQNATAIEEAVEIFRKCANNMANNIQLSSGQNIITTYPRFSLFNHSCHPNIKHTCFQDGSIQGVAVTNIPKGQPLLISYILQKLPFSIRQKQLLQWKFCCRCQRCTSNIEGQVVLKEMEKEKKQGLKINKYKDYKFPPDMYIEAFVCKCGNPLFRVYQNAQQVTVDGNWNQINQPYYYLCQKCLIPCLQSESEQTEINYCLSCVEEQQKANQIHAFQRHLKRIGGKFPLFHPFSCVYNIILDQQVKDFKRNGDLDNALSIGSKLVENIEYAWDRVPNRECADIYCDQGNMSCELKHLPQAYKYLTKAKEQLNILFSKSDDKDMKFMLLMCKKNIELIKYSCHVRNIPLD
ncbi:MAG: hypothetical protein EZS28_013333 [Streblomastix strix]|uniref:Uncharacterized protein n=1 Tax=Streblomastix strix TaxID=222440 RepID=A0A5J4W8G4_9EUKA|nr:MAG: hypothetical protein EZS28_013333 [Streblomastix strix]